MHVGGKEVKLNHALCTLKMASTILFLLANHLQNVNICLRGCRVYSFGLFS